jgi:hypothetical protein
MRNGFTTQIETVQGNYGYNLPFTLTDSAGVAVDITNASLVFEAQLDSDNSVQFSGSMNITNGPAGTCYYTVQSTDFPQAGIWNVQIKATYTGEVLTWTGITVNIDAQLPVT